MSPVRFDTSQEQCLLDTQALSIKEFLELIAVRQLAFSDKVGYLTFFDIWSNMSWGLGKRTCFESRCGFTDSPTL